MVFTLVAFILLVVVAELVARPFLVRAAPSPVEIDDSLTIQKDQILESIRDLDMDLATGKVSERDHAELRARYLAEAAGVLEEIDRAATVAATVAVAVPAPVSVPDAAPALDAAPAASAPDGRAPGDRLSAIEARIAARKRALEAATCQECGTAHEPDDRFCRKCGSTLGVAAVPGGGDGGD